MDGLAMALHLVWTKKSFKECAIWAANMGGDCDTVGAIACQIAGALSDKILCEVLNDFVNIVKQHAFFELSLECAVKLVILC